jgi:hypothetical protein
MTSKFLLILCIQSIFCFAQENPVAKKYGAMVDSIQLKDNLDIIASDALEGRLTGKRGQKMAAAFIANHFKEIGLHAPVNGSYFQSINLTSIKLAEAYMVVNGVKHGNFTDVFYINDEDTNGDIEEAIYQEGSERKRSDREIAEEEEREEERRHNEWLQAAEDYGGRIDKNGYYITGRFEESTRAQTSELLAGLGSLGDRMGGAWGDGRGPGLDLGPDIFGRQRNTYSGGGGNQYTLSTKTGGFGDVIPSSPITESATSAGDANINVSVMVKPQIIGGRLSPQSEAEIKQAAAAGANAALRSFYGR